MSIPVNQCILCNHTESSLFDERMFRDMPIINKLCSHCGLVYQSPRPSDSELQVFYEEEYRQVYQGDAGPGQKDLSTQRGRAESLLVFVQKQNIQPKKHLDIGCSAGILLNKFQEAFHTQPAGIEPGNAYRGYARRQGLIVYPSIEQMEISHPDRYDFISLAHVLEHIPDPINYLINIKEKWLTSDGNLLIEVPNLYGHDCFEIAHLVSYSLHTLIQTLQQAGYEIQATQVHGMPRSQILDLYITVLAKYSGIPKNTSAQKYPFALSQINPVPERNVKLKRKMGILRRQILTRLFPRKAWMATNHK